MQVTCKASFFLWRWILLQNYVNILRVKVQSFLNVSSSSDADLYNLLPVRCTTLAVLFILKTFLERISKGTDSMR